MVTDQTRWQRKPTSYDSLALALSHMQAFYRRNLWLAQDNYVEIWIEKEALAGVVYPITEKWDVSKFRKFSIVVFVVFTHLES